MTTVLLFTGLVALLITIVILAIERSHYKDELYYANKAQDFWYDKAYELRKSNDQLRQDLKDAVELERLIKDEERDHHELFLEFSEGQRKYWNKRYSALLADIRDATSLKELRKWGKADDL